MMNATESTADLRAELVRARRSFVQATVVRTEQPTSARPGDKAIITEDGNLEGFVGGQCTVSSVKVAALDALRDGHSVLLRVLPDGAPEFPETTGSSVVVNPCLSGGSVEIYLEPVRPAPILYVAGVSPIARAVAKIGAEIGYAVEFADDSAAMPEAAAVLIARHGGSESSEVRAALDAGVVYVGLVASAKRGSAVLAELDLTAEEEARVHCPAGLAIGAITPEEIAISVLAEITAMRTPAAPAAADPRKAQAEPVTIGSGPAAAQTAIDPICGMTVVVSPDAIHLAVDGEDFYFCATGCRDKYADQRGVS